MREFKGKLAVAFAIWALITAIFHLYTAFLGSFEPRLQRAIHLLLLLPLVFLVFPSKTAKINSKVSFIDWLLTILAFLPSLYLILHAEELRRRVEQVDPVTTTQLFLGSLMIILVIEACRRAVSFIFALTVTITLSYIFLAPYLPGVFSARSIGFDRVIDVLYLSSDEGLYGFLTGISSNVLFVFIIFASMMLRSGVGQFLMDVSVLLAGKYRGGPAKVAVLSSGLYGSICGSSVADVYSTGSFSIPLMRQIGYPKTKAGAIEAVACAGGPLLPPVMGAGAFIMAEMTSTSYSTIIQAALLGALVYYIGILSTVHFEAVSMNLKTVSKDLYVSWKSIAKRVPFLLSLIFMVYLLLNGYSPSKSAVYAFILMIIIWIIASRRNFKWQDLLHGFSYAAKGGAVIAAALAGSGILVAVVNQTGIATAVSNIIIEYSNGNVWIALFLVMLVTLILGAGIPTTPAYVITISVAAGALAYFNVPTLGAHLFVFYFAILADVSPPVGVTAFAAAGIAGAPPMKTSVLTTKFAFAGFVVPYIFVANPALLMDEQFSWTTILLTFILTVIGVILISSVLVGALFQKIGIWKRIFLLFIALLIMGGQLFISLSGVAILIAFIVWEYKNYHQLKGVISNNNNNLVETGGV